MNVLRALWFVTYISIQLAIFICLSFWPFVCSLYINFISKLNQWQKGGLSLDKDCSHFV